MREWQHCSGKSYRSHNDNARKIRSLFPKMKARMTKAAQVDAEADFLAEKNSRLGHAVFSASPLEW
jgi:hypothetical protein